MADSRRWEFEENTSSSDLECGEVCLHVIFFGQNAKHTSRFHLLSFQSSKFEFFHFNPLSFKYSQFSLPLVFCGTIIYLPKQHCFLFFIKKKKGTQGNGFVPLAFEYQKLPHPHTLEPGLIEKK